MGRAHCDASTKRGAAPRSCAADALRRRNQGSCDEQGGIMQIDLVVKDTQLDAYGQERMRKKLAKTLGRHRREVPIRVAVEEKKGFYDARVVGVVAGRELVGHADSRILLEALDEALAKFDKQFLKLSDRFAKRPKARSGRKDGLEVTDATGSEDDLDEQLVSG
jgi:ribosome-associated translation inhibitor RaiA